MTETISSRRHPLIQFARSLRDRRTREQKRVFLVEGPRIIRDGLRAGFVPHLLFWTPERCSPDEQRVLELARQRGVRIVSVSDEVLRLITETMTPQGVVAVFPFPNLPIQIPLDERALLLVVDRLQDPGNLGTLLRSALGAGAHGVYLTPGTVDPFNAKAVRAAAGAHFRLPLASLSSATIECLRETTEIVIADPRADRHYDQMNWTSPITLVIGSEAHGVSEALRNVAQATVSIPLYGGLESLNAAAAGSVLLFEAARQRRLAGQKATIRK